MVHIRDSMKEGGTDPFTIFVPAQALPISPHLAAALQQVLGANRLTAMVNAGPRLLPEGFNDAGFHALANQPLTADRLLVGTDIIALREVEDRLPAAAGIRGAVTNQRVAVRKSPPPP